MNRLLPGFAPDAAVSLIQVVARAIGAEAVTGPTKLLLMPLLAVAALWGGAYCLGQGFIAAVVIVADRLNTAAAELEPAPDAA